MVITITVRDEESLTVLLAAIQRNFPQDVEVDVEEKNTHKGWYDIFIERMFQ